MIGYPELILILAIVLILFGADKLPEMAKSLGKATKEFKKAQVEAASEIKKDESPENRDEKIRKLATDMGIDIKGKTTDQLTEEIRTRVRVQADK